MRDLWQVALEVVFTSATVYLSFMFLVSRIHSSLSPPTGCQIPIWCPRMQLGTLYILVVVYDRVGRTKSGQYPILAR